MKRIFFMMVLILVAVLALVALAGQHQGQVVFRLGGWEYGASFLSFGIFLIGLFVVSALLIRLSVSVLRIPARVSAALERNRRKQAREKLGEGLAAYAGGDYKRAAASLAKTDALGAPLNGAVNMLLARCKMHCGDADEARRALNKARRAVSDGEILDLLQIETQASEQPPEATVRKLMRVIDKNPDNLRAIECLRKLCSENGLWKIGGETFLRVSAALELPERDSLDTLACAATALMRDAAERKDGQRVRWLWRNCDARVRERTQADYAVNMMRAGMVGKGESILKRLIEADWNSQAIERFASPDIAEGAQERLEQAKRWLASQPDNPALLAAVARLYRQCGLSAQAKEHFEKSLALRPDYKVWREAMAVESAERK